MAGAQPRPPPNAGSAAPRYGFRLPQTQRSLSTECALHREHGRGQITHDELGLEPNDAITGPRELAIPTCIRGHAASVIAAIGLDDEPSAWCVKVSDEAEERVRTKAP